MTAAGAERLIARVLADDLELRQSAHAISSMQERGFSILDVRAVLVRHLLEREPLWSERHRNWAVTLLGSDRLGRRTRVVLALAEDSSCNLVTVMRVRGAGESAEETT